MPANPMTKHSEHTPSPRKRLPRGARKNRRLIAAAPELLEALRGVLDTSPIGDCWCDNGHSQNGTQCYGCIARAAIAKAEGRDI